MKTKTKAKATGKKAGVSAKAMATVREDCKYCMIPGCKRHAEVRGVCNPCYLTARNLIDTGRATDEDLVAAGLLLGGARSANPLRAAFNKVTEKTAKVKA